MGTGFVVAMLLQGVQTPSVDPSAITNPVWIRRPGAGDVARYYPVEAQRRNLGGRATLNCSVDTEGKLTACKVTEEIPADLGFGEAVLRMAPLFQMRPAAANGAPVAGGTVRVPIRFSLEGGAQDAIGQMYACYGQSAARSQQAPDDQLARRAFGFYAAQVAMHGMQGVTTPEALEAGLTAARKAALAGQAQAGQPSLKECIAHVPKPN